mgnify:CR=1 FL=1
MVDATPNYLDPGLGTVTARPSGLQAGDYPQQARAASLRFWTIGISTRAIRDPFGDSVGTPLHYEYDLCPTNLLAIDCRGDPENPDDRSVVQIAQNNPPQASRVFTTWFWHDWIRNTSSAVASWNRNLATKTANAYLGQQTRASSDRPVLGVSGLTANGGIAVSLLTSITLAAPGSATKTGLDCPLVSEDGSAAAPVPLRVPCWVGRWGFRGATGQVLSAGNTTQNLGFFLKIKPLALSFVEDAANLKIAFTAATAEYGCEVFGACAYTLAFVQNPATYQDPDFTQPGPIFPCKVYGDRCWRSSEQTAYAQVFLTPIGDAWQAVVTISQVMMNRTAAGGRYMISSNFVPAFYTQKGTVSQTKPADDVTATTIGFGTTTAISRGILAGSATLTVTITVSATGIVTLCEARITRNVAVTNLGPGWHDKFVKL